MIIFNNTFRRFPLAIAVGVSIVRYTSADALVQISELENKWSKWDYPRSTAFMIFGLYCGTFWANLYGRYYGVIVARLTSRGIPKPFAALGISFMDTTLVCSVFYYPVYYILQEYCHTGRFSPRTGCESAWKNRYADIGILTLFYCPMNAINLFLIPPHFRAIYANIIPSTIWGLILSKMRGKYEEENDATN